MHKYEYKLCNGLLGKQQAPSWLAEYLKGSADSSMLSFEYKKQLHRNNKYANTEKYNNTQGCSPKRLVDIYSTNFEDKITKYVLAINETA